MKVLKIIGIGLLVLVAFVLIAGLFAPKEFAVSRTVTIARPSGEVFAYIRLLRNQNNYSVWGKKVPAMQVTYTGTDGTPGFRMAWKGNSDVGEGEQTIRAITGGKRMESDLLFKEPWESKATSYLSTEPEGAASTNVTWGLNGSMAYPFNTFGLFMNMDKALGKDLEIGLSNLKQLQEDGKITDF